MSQLFFCQAFDFDTDTFCLKPLKAARPLSVANKFYCKEHKHFAAVATQLNEMYNCFEVFTHKLKKAYAEFDNDWKTCGCSSLPPLCQLLQLMSSPLESSNDCMYAETKVLLKCCRDFTSPRVTPTDEKHILIRDLMENLRCDESINDMSGNEYDLGISGPSVIEQHEQDKTEQEDNHRPTKKQRISLRESAIVKHD